MIQGPLSKPNPTSLINLGLVAVAVACIFYEHGLAPGLRMSFALASLLVLFRASISISMGFLLRGMLLGKLDRLLLLIPLAYLAVSLALDWAGLILIGIIGIVGGLFVGVVCAIASPHHRWR